MKLDILAFAAHPDDVELSCAGTLMKHIDQGKKVGIIDLTQGELGTRGDSHLRLEEAEMAGNLMGIHARENLQMKDGFFDTDEENKRKIIHMIRKYQPTVVLANALEDRHPDHARAAKLVADASFLSGLRRIETSENGMPQHSHRPSVVYHYIQDYYLQPDIIVDVTAYAEKKFEAIKAFKSQFYNPESNEPTTPISGADFMDFIEGRMMQYGRVIGARYGEGFNVSRPVGVKNFFDLD